MKMTLAVTYAVLLGMLWGVFALRATTAPTAIEYIECLSVAPDAAMGGAPPYKSVRFCIPSKDVPLLYN